MGLGTLRSILGPVSRTLLRAQPPSSSTFSLIAPAAASYHRITPWTAAARCFNSLTDTRFPKRRPADKNRRKRATLKPPGPYAWVKYVPGEPILPNQPNEGSVKGRNAKKRIRLKRAFILAEKKKRKAQLQEAKKKKHIQVLERKMAAVARHREWAKRLAELQKLEEEKKKSMA